MVWSDAGVPNTFYDSCRKGTKTSTTYQCKLLEELKNDVTQRPRNCSIVCPRMRAELVGWG